jgi:hypothetical protein
MINYLRNNILLLILLVALSTQAQDEILFLNGKVIKGNLIEKTNYEFTFKTDKNKQFVIDKYRIFSFTQNNKETIVYKFDTLSGNFLKVEDMKYFVYGERDAHITYKPHFSNVLGFAIGGAAGYFMHKEDAFLYITVPLVYTIGTLVFPTRVRQHKIKDVQFIKEDEYLRGYERIARSKRTQGALKTSIVGMGVGFLISFIANKSSD